MIDLQITCLVLLLVTFNLFASYLINIGKLFDNSLEFKTK